MLLLVLGVQLRQAAEEGEEEQVAVLVEVVVVLVRLLLMLIEQAELRSAGCWTCALECIRQWADAASAPWLPLQSSCSGLAAQRERKRVFELDVNCVVENGRKVMWREQTKQNDDISGNGCKG